MSSLPLPNYLRTNRKRLSLTQDEVAFLLGFRGTNNGSKVCRDEKYTREPRLRMALAYDVIYQSSVRELFAGLYRQIEQEVATRAKILNFRKNQKPGRKTEHKREVLAGLAALQSKQGLGPMPS